MTYWLTSHTVEKSGRMQRARWISAGTSCDTSWSGLMQLLSGMRVGAFVTLPIKAVDPEERDQAVARVGRAYHEPEEGNDLSAADS